MRLINKKLTLIAVIFFILGIIVTFLLTKYKQDDLKSQDSRKSNNSLSNEEASLANFNDCQSRIKIPDVSSDGVNDYIVICRNELLLALSSPDNEFGKAFETIQTFPDLFYNEILGKDFRIPQIVEINENSNLGLLINIRAISCRAGPWCTKGAGLYLIKAGNVKRIFQLTDKNPVGRTGYVEIISTNPLSIKTRFDLGFVGGLGNRYYWSNYYDWDISKDELVLANNKYPGEFRKLLAEYEQFERDPCASDYNPQENLANETISTLYEKRKTEKKLCPNGENDSASPFTGDAKGFLKAKKTIEDIIDGLNYSDKDT